jgi:hypothetical protein
VGEHGGESGFPYPAFAGEDEDFVAHGGEAGCDEWDVRVGAFGRGGAYGLVGAAGAVVGFACLLRFGAGTVFCMAELESAQVRMVGGRRRSGGARCTWFRRDELGRSLEGRIEVDLRWFFE